MHHLTIAMACYRSFDSAYFTLLDLRKSHGQDFDILVVDNAPESCLRTKSTALACRAKYVHRPDLNGTTRPRNACFQYAKTPWVMVIDDHVLLDNGAVAAAIDYAKKNPQSRDIISGPMLGDDGVQIWTHWSSGTKSGLWGSWDVNTEFRKRWGHAGPGWTHESARTAVDRMEPFETPAMGLGLWMMRKEAWPEFNPHFRGFGGEEGYIHEKTRRLGGKSLCHPRLRWHHKFRDVGGFVPVPYPLRLEDHVRNLLLGSRELGIDADEEIWKDFGVRLGGGVESFDRIKANVHLHQDFNAIYERKRLRVLGVWYSNNAAPEPLLQNSLKTILNAKNESYHDVRVGTSVWSAIPRNPFPQSVATDEIRKRPGHWAIVGQVRAAWNAGAHPSWKPDVICHLEHDVLYPPGYFDRIADAFCAKPGIQVVSNLDYIGLNETGWLNVVQRHEPLHQIGMSADRASENLDRAEEDCRNTGGTYLEPDHNQDRSSWCRLDFEGFAPSVHVNHHTRFTNHGEVVYERSSTMGAGGRPGTNHPFWGPHKSWWPYPVEESNMACGGCNQNQAAAVAKTLEPISIDSWFEAEKKAPPDFHEHMETLRTLASSVKHATEMSAWPKQAYLAIAAGMPSDGILVSISQGGKGWWPKMLGAIGSRLRMVKKDPMTVEIDPTELLFLDSNHTAQKTYDELSRHANKVSKYIVIHTVAHDTFGNTGDDGGPGVMYGIRRWLKEGASQQWVVKKFYTNNHGMIILSRDLEDRPKIEFGIRSAWKYLQSRIRHKINGGTYLTLPMAQERLDICLTCEDRGGRDGNNCKICKCYLAILPDSAPINKGGPGKTFIPTEFCPAGKWSDRASDGVEMTPEEVDLMLDQLATDTGIES